MKNNIWIPGEEAALYKEWIDKRNEEFMNCMLWGTLPKRESKEDDNVKLAWVEINGKRKMLGVDNKTMQGYRMEENIPTYKLPLEKEKYNKFERWCTTFDV